MSSGSFTLQLEKFKEKVAGQASDFVGLVVIGVAAELDFRSPVGDATYWKSKPPKGYIGGHFRANWQLGVGERPSAPHDGVDTSPKDRKRGGANVGQMLSVLPGDGQNAGKIYWLSNNVPYAQRLEDGWSHLAPQGVVGLTVTMFDQIVKDAVEALE